MPPSIADALRGVAGTTIIEQPGLRYIWIGLNVEKPPFDTVKVRQAIRAAIDVDQMLIAGYSGKVKRANAMIQPQLLGYWKDAPTHKRDVAAAKRLLAEAGLPNGFNAKLLLENVPVHRTMALVAQASLAEAGIRIEIDAREGASFASAGSGDAGKNLDMIMLRYNARMDPSFSTQWFVSSQVGINNWQRWRSPEYDRLHEKAASTMDEKARA